MIISTDHRAIVLPPAARPDTILPVISTAKVLHYEGHDLVVVPHGLDEVRVLRNLGIEAPSPIGFDKTNWAIMRLGTTSLQSNQASSSRGGQRILIADNGSSAATAAEMNSRFTSDLGAAIDCRYFTLIGNPDPTTRMHVREVRLDYRATSASSVSLRMSPDFGTTYPVDTGVALPVNAQSGQSVVGVSMTAIYPGVELRHASGHTFALQGLSAVVESMGNG